LAALVLGIVLVSGCAHAPARQDGHASAGEAPASEIAELALALRGEPYRFGGEGPGGFDCSGLVHYVHRQAGIEVPRTARGQFEAVERVYPSQLRVGDVVFFRTTGAFVSHVGIYVGESRFVHALNHEQPVTVADLDKRYWRQRLVRAGSLTR
jgi:cell wall-associated NlpC family hydrolase